MKKNKQVTIKKGRTYRETQERSEGSDLEVINYA